MSLDQGLPASASEADMVHERRQFLAKCGKFAVVTPPAITLLLSTSLNSSAIANSGGKGGNGNNGNNGFGNGGQDGSPNGKEDDDR